MVFRANSISEYGVSYVIMVAARSEALAGRISASRGQEAAVCVFAENGCADWRGGGEWGPREVLFLRLWVNCDNMGVEESKAKHEGRRSEGKIKMRNERPVLACECAGRWRGTASPENQLGTMIQPWATSLVGGLHSLMSDPES